MDVLAAQGFISFTYCLLDMKAYIQSLSSRIYQSSGIGALRPRILTRFYHVLTLVYTISLLFSLFIW